MWKLNDRRMTRVTNKQTKKRTNRRGSNQYRTKKRNDGLKWITLYLASFACMLYAGYLYREHAPQVQARSASFISPLADSGTASESATLHLRTATPSATPAPVAEGVTRKIDEYAGQAIDEFFESNSQRSEMRMIMHCLLHRESGHQAHDADGPHGDGGRAGGVLQFHEPTWIGYRKLMIKEGVAESIGSRYDLKEAIRTTVWAIRDGRGQAWGPIYRTLRGDNWATCPAPSFYN